MKTHNCEKCNSEMTEISGFNPEGLPFTEYRCLKCKTKKVVMNKPKVDELENLHIKIGKTLKETEIRHGDRKISNCDSFLITGDSQSNKLTAHLSITHFPTEVEISQWDTSFKLIGTRTQQIDCLEAILTKLKAEKPEPLVGESTDQLIVDEPPEEKQESE